MISVCKGFGFFLTNKKFIADTTGIGKGSCFQELNFLIINKKLVDIKQARKRLLGPQLRLQLDDSLEHLQAIVLLYHP